MRIIIRNTPGKPIYEQITEQIRAAIFSDELQEGDMLPSIRQLARDLRISVITTTRAYTELEQEGLIVSVQGKGSFVSPKNSELVREQLIRRIEEAFTVAISAAETAGLPPEELISILEFMLEGDRYE